jgi:hypothetical protein
VATELVAAAARMFRASAALRAREHAVIAHYTESLAALIAEETGAGADDTEPWVAANALMGVHRAVLDAARRRMLTSGGNVGLAEDVRAATERAFALLEHGLAGYGAKD